MASELQTLITVPEKSVFTSHFLQTLSKIKQKKPFNPNYNKNQTNKRARKIKTAAYQSMARVAGGTSRPWTRALLWKLRNCRKKEGQFLKRRRKSKRGNRGGRRPRQPADEETKKLRRMVPGGGGLETWSLMEETAHYINCLSMQVKVMQSLVDRLSP